MMASALALASNQQAQKQLARRRTKVTDDEPAGVPLGVRRT